MRIIIDIDGTITELKKTGQTYTSVRINPGAADKIRSLKAAGHTIILQTARHMKTCGGDQGQVVAKIGKPTLDWLTEQEIPYDEIYFGKPYGDVYIDDLALPFTNWDQITPDSLDDTKINIVIPMAGAGSRFIKAGFTEPKPLIKSHGKTLIEWAVASFDTLRARRNAHLIFVILEEHNQSFKLGDKLRVLFGTDITVISIGAVTSGQATTCLAAKQLINNFNQLIIYNCDTYTTGNEALLDVIEAKRPDGVLACFDATDPRYSFARVDKLGYVDLTTEKNPVSSHASTGLYYFRRGQDFIRAAEAMMHSGETAKGEYYVAPCYNELLKAGKKIKIYNVKDNWVLGTPDELEYFNTNYSPL
jgi:capsule biosynthesis phosphatase